MKKSHFNESNDSILPKNSFGCPFLILAPMEGVGDQCFRKALQSVGGFDEAVRDFIRVPVNAHVKSLAKVYDPHELNPIPIAAQIMGSDPVLMADMAQELVALGAKRIDVNCGCPSNTVTGKGAGSSLLKDPTSLFAIASSVVKSVTVPVTVKMRSGFEDTSLFVENLEAAQESGIAFLTLHPRTKVEGYGPPANWDLIAKAKQILRIPVVGNGDILNVSDALKMLKETGCDALMIGRGSVINPFIFQEIKAHFSNVPLEADALHLISYIQKYVAEIIDGTDKSKMNRLKQLLGFIFKANDKLQFCRQEILSTHSLSFEEFLDFAILHLKRYW